MGVIELGGRATRRSLSCTYVGSSDRVLELSSNSRGGKERENEEEDEAGCWAILPREVYSIEL